MILDPAQKSHFDSIAQTWKHKGWVNSTTLNKSLDTFIHRAESQMNLEEVRHRSLLYLGIGTGALFQSITGYNVAGVDQSSLMLEQCPEGVIQILENAEQLPFLMPNQFHMGLCRNLLKHCLEPRRVAEVLYDKLRPGYAVIAFESVVYEKSDVDVPTQLVRMTDPNHPRFQTVEEVTQLFWQAGFSDVSYDVVPFRDTWLKKWIIAEQAGADVHQEALELYRRSPQFVERYHAQIHADDITSTVPWIMVMAKKQ